MNKYSRFLFFVLLNQLPISHRKGACVRSSYSSGDDNVKEFQREAAEAGRTAANSENDTRLMAHKKTKNGNKSAAKCGMRPAQCLAADQ